MTKEEIGAVIKKARVSAGLTQAFVAEQLNRPQQTIANWEIGRSQPDANTLFLLFQVLGIGLDEAFGLPSMQKNVSLSADEQTHIKKYRLLDDYGKEAVDSVLNVEYRRCTEKAQETSLPKIDIAAEVASYEAELRLQEQVEGKSLASDGPSGIGGAKMA